MLLIQIFQFLFFEDNLSFPFPFPHLSLFNTISSFGVLLSQKQVTDSEVLKTKKGKKHNHFRKCFSK